MKSLFGVDYEAGYSGEIPKDVSKLFKKAKIKLSKKAYIVFPYDDKGQPAFIIVVDGEKAWMVLDDGIYGLGKSSDLSADDLILIVSDDVVDVVALEADAEYFKLTPESHPEVVALGFIHEELGLRHAVIPLADMIEITGEEKDKYVADAIKTFEENGLDIGFKPEDFKMAFIGLSEEGIQQTLEDENKGEEVEEYEEYFPEEDELPQEIEPEE